MVSNLGKKIVFEAVLRRVIQRLSLYGDCYGGDNEHIGYQLGLLRRDDPGEGNDNITKIYQNPVL